MIPEEPAAVADNSFGRPQISRKSSFSDAINKFTTTTFNRRRTTNVLPHSASSTHFHHKSRLPTPSGIPRSTSFLSSLGNFVSNTTDPHTYQDENDPPQPSGKRSRRISDRLAQTPFVQQQSSHPSIPTAPATQSKRRESCVKIEQRGLMQPMPPPLPKSSTMGDLLSAHTTCSTLQLTPNASRPASSLADRKGSLVTNKRGNVLTPPMRVVRLQKAPGSFPKRKDSLMPPPSRAIDVLHDAGNEAGAAHSSSPISSYAEEDTVLRVSNKQGKSAYRYESMIGKQYSSFKEEFDTENPPRLQEIKADENPPSIKTDQHNNKQESSNESAAADPDDIDNPRLVRSHLPPCLPNPTLTPPPDSLPQAPNLLAGPLHRPFRHDAMLSSCIIRLTHHHYREPSGLLLRAFTQRSSPLNAQRRPAAHGRLLASESLVPYR